MTPTVPPISLPATSLYREKPMKQFDSSLGESEELGRRGSRGACSSLEAAMLRKQV